MKNIDLEIFKKYYIEENHSQEEAAKYFGCSKYLIAKFCKENDLLKGKGNGRRSDKKQEDSNVIKGINVEELKKYYIDENHSQSECASYFNCSRSTIQRVCNKAHLIKDENSINQSRNAAIKKKYGVDNVFKNSEMQEKIKGIIKEKYGVDNISQLDEIKEKKKQTTLLHYGVENPALSEEVQSRIRETCLERYGAASPLESPEIKDKIKESMIKKYGADHPMRVEQIKNKVLLDAQATCMEKYGVPYYVLTDDCREALENSTASSVHSKPNEKFANFLTENKIDYTREVRIGAYSYDFAIDNKLIEINPTATHNIEWSPFGDHTSRIDRNYHKNKRNEAINDSKQCFMIWDWDNHNAIKNYFVSKKEKIYARNCDIKLISENESENFISNYHFQGYAKAKITYGLFYNQELISVMSFGSPRYNKNYEWEIIRYCSSKNIIGGAEKLFSHFINDNNPISIVSYCDISKFSGDTYQKLGFNILRTNQPSLHWYNLKDKRHFTDNLIRAYGVSRIVNKCEPSEDQIAVKANTNDNYTLMLLNNFLPVYDCGQQTWVWNRKTPLE